MTTFLRWSAVSGTRITSLTCSSTKNMALHKGQSTVHSFTAQIMFLIENILFQGLSPKCCHGLLSLFSKNQEHSNNSRLLWNVYYCIFKWTKIMTFSIKKNKNNNCHSIFKSYETDIIFCLKWVSTRLCSTSATRFHFQSEICNGSRRNSLNE